MIILSLPVHGIVFFRLVSVKPYSCITYIFIRLFTEVYETLIVLGNMRKDLTISLEEECINALLEIAENKRSTLSALIRDIFSSYIQAVTKGKVPDFSDLAAFTGETADDLESSVRLSGTVARHGVLIAELERRVSLLEGRSAIPDIQPVQPQTFIPAPGFTAVTSPVAAAVMPLSAGIIDSDIPLVGNLSEEALVKARQPVAPVMDAMEMGSIRIVAEKEYSQTEAAVALGVSVSTIRRYVKEKKIPARKVGRAWLIYGKDILAYAGEQD
ncbi:MAG: helix-turn-helix domain-containing protein [Methanomicrobiales archaeon]|jgi:excisionase family DNA binding protein|nr:helix-turn-helix domain-containing protein [Methanomicrobiales archaeon]